MSAKMERRRFLQVVAGAAAGGPAAVRCATAPRREGRLNVLFMMTDEQHFRSLSITGNPYVQTPNMDRIAREGALFTNATCVTPYCSPSRASIITGVYPHTHGILMNVNLKRGKQRPLDPKAFGNTESILHENRYATGHRGKWHLGDKGDFGCYESWSYASKTPGEYRDFLAKHLPGSRFADDKDPGRYLGRPVRKVPAVRKGWKAFNALPNNRLGYIATIGRCVVPPELLPETQITGQVLELLDRHAGRDFMITASWSPPHDLWVVPEPYYSMVDRGKVKPTGSTKVPAWDQRGPSKRLGDIMGAEGLREYIAIYHGMVKYIDDQVGRVLRKLDDLGLAERTLVIFTSDHGDMAGAHGCIGKSIAGFYDDLVRIPMAMRLPGRIGAGTVVKQPVSQIDLMPTILDYLDLPAPRKVHGRSMRPLIEGRKVPWRDYAFCQRANRMRMLRTRRWKYFCDVAGRIRALYDLQNDPHEDRNLAGEPDHADDVRRMHARLLEIMKRDNDPMAKKLPADPLA